MAAHHLSHANFTRTLYRFCGGQIDIIDPRDENNKYSHNQQKVSRIPAAVGFELHDKI